MNKIDILYLAFFTVFFLHLYYHKLYFPHFWFKSSWLACRKQKHCICKVQDGKISKQKKMKPNCEKQFISLRWLCIYCGFAVFQSVWRLKVSMFFYRGKTKHSPLLHVAAHLHFLWPSYSRGWEGKKWCFQKRLQRQVVGWPNLIYLFSLEAMAGPLVAVRCVVCLRGHVKMQRLDYLRQSKCPEGQPAGRDQH